MAAKEPVTTPRGSLMYLTIDGEGKENFDGDGMIYEASIDLPDEEANVLLDKLDDFQEANAPKGDEWKEASVPYKEHGATKSNGEELDIPEGHVRFTFKTNVTLPSGDKQTVRIYDKNNRESTLPENIKIGNGSKGRVSGTMVLYTRDKAKEYGVSLFLKNVKLLDLVPYTAESGFEDCDDEDGSFEGFNTTSDYDEEPEEKPTRERSRRSRRSRRG